MTERIISVAAQAMAARARVDTDDPEPQIAAAALVGLWRVQYEQLKIATRAAQDARRQVLAAFREARAGTLARGPGRTGWRDSE